MTVTAAPSERVFGVAAAMLRHPEPTKEPMALGITAIEIQFDQVHSAIAITTSTLYVTAGLALYVT